VRGRLLEAGRRLFAERGYHGTSTRDIAEACDLPPASIYNCFSSKEELFGALVKTYFDVLLPRHRDVAALPVSGLERLRLLVKDSVEVGWEYRLELITMERGWAEVVRDSQSPRLARIDQQREELAALYRRVVEEGVADGSIRPDIDVPVALSVVFYAIPGLIRNSQDAGRTTAPSASALADVLVNGLATGATGQSAAGESRIARGTGARPPRQRKGRAAEGVAAS
jgi:AcrR family transcriptional regulator